MHISVDSKVVVLYVAAKTMQFMWQMMFSSYEQIAF